MMLGGLAPRGIRVLFEKENADFQINGKPNLLKKLVLHMMSDSVRGLNLS